MKNTERFPSKCKHGIKKQKISSLYYCDIENKYCIKVDLCPMSEEYDNELNNFFNDTIRYLLNK